MCITGVPSYNYVQFHHFLTGSRYRKYLELRDIWEREEGGEGEGDSLSAYYSNNYHKLLNPEFLFFNPDF